MIKWFAEWRKHAKLVLNPQFDLTDKPTSPTQPPT